MTGPAIPSKWTRWGIGDAPRLNTVMSSPSGLFWAGVLEFKTEDGKRYPGQLWRFDPSTKEATVVDEDGITVCVCLLFWVHV